MKLCVVAVVCLLAFVKTARADDLTAAREHYQKGSKLFALGRFAEAVHEYEAAYEAKDDPVLLYNIAQAHRMAGNAQRAFFFYRSYLSREPNAANREEVQQKMAELQKAIDQQARAQRLQPDTPIAPDRAPSAAGAARAPSPAPAPATLTAPATAPAPSTATAERDGRHQMIAGLAVVGAGAAVGVAGVVLAGLALDAKNQLYADAAAGRPFVPSKESKGRAFDIAGPVLYSIGAAAVVAGSVVAALGANKARRARRSEHAWLVPAVGPSVVGVAAQGAF
jgi:tetratricopeptide (TPR) repeat protein